MCLQLLKEMNDVTPHLEVDVTLTKATKNKTKVLAHAGSTVVLPCTVAEESKFEMVSFSLRNGNMELEAFY